MHPRTSRLALLMLGLAAAPSIQNQAEAQEAAFPQRTVSFHAHPRVVRSFIGVYEETRAPIESQLVRMGLGDEFFFAQWTEGSTWLHLALTAGVMGEFDMAVSSFDFLAADFIVGVPLSVRRGDFIGRLRLYHQSSHLGDDLIGREDAVFPDLRAFDFEAVEGFASWRLGPVWPYGGAEVRFRRTPGRQDATVFHLGVQTGDALRGPGAMGDGRLRWIGGAHLAFADHGEGGAPSLTVRGGLEVLRGPPGGARRGVRIQLELFDGPAPAGRFFGQERRSIGLSVGLGR